MTVLVHVLARNKEPVLPFYLKSLEEWDYPKNDIVLYVKTNNNTDKTLDILDRWVSANRRHYLDVIYETHDFDVNIERTRNHEWTRDRLTIIRGLRDRGLSFAREYEADFYFTSDCDNFLLPHTLSSLVALNVPVVAPLLRYAEDENEVAENAAAANWMYSTFTTLVNEYGDTQHGAPAETFPSGYFDVLHRAWPGLHQVELVHATYLLRRDVLNVVSYQNGVRDGFDYIILAFNLRQAGIPQLLDNRETYGCLTLAENNTAVRSYMSQLKESKP